MNHKVIAVVVTYNRRELLDRCMRSLLSQTKSLYGILIIDNASTDGTRDMMEDYLQKYPEKIWYHRLLENCGGSGGFYQGLSRAMLIEGWEWVLVMDDDAAPYPDYVEKLLEGKSCYPEINCFIGTEYVGDSERKAYGSRRVIDREKTLHEALVKEEEYRKPSFLVDTVTFVGPMFHRSIIEQAGLPDASFFIYYDDTEYCLRIRKYTRIMVITAARIRHRVNFEQDVLGAGQKEWRQFYMYRNHLAVKKRYISNPLLKYLWIGKAYLRECRKIIFGKDLGERRTSKVFRSIYLVTRATLDVVHDRLGKAEYIRYE